MRFSRLAFGVGLLAVAVVCHARKDNLPPVPFNEEMGNPCVKNELKFESPEIKNRFWSDVDNFDLLYWWAKRGYKKRFEDGKCNDFNLAVSSWQKVTDAPISGVLSGRDVDSILRARGRVPQADRKKEGALKSIQAN